MTLEQQVTSRELSQKLKDLGVPQFSYFMWSKWKYGELVYGKGAEVYEGDYEIKVNPVKFDPDTQYSAFTVAELGEMLPEGTSTRKGWGMDSGYVIFDNEANKICSADTEADARAKMLIYLVEHNLITL